MREPRAGKHRYTPAAARNDDIAQLQALLAGGADVNSADTLGTTPLHRAAARHNLPAMNALLEAGARVNARAGGGDTPLHRAVASTKDRHPPSTTRPYHTPPQLYIRDWRGTPVVSDRDTAVVAALVRAGGDLEARNDSGETPLATAARHGNSGLVSKLLELGASPEPGVTAVAPPAIPVCDWAAHTMFANAPVVSIEGCLKAGADVSALDRRGHSPLHALVLRREFNHYILPAALTALLEAGADANARNEWDDTPLHQASGDLTQWPSSWPVAPR